jgi:SRSO17 transposase
MQYNIRNRFSDREPISTAPILDLPWQDLKTIRRVLPAYHRFFSSGFSRREQQRWSLVYLHGLLTDIRRKSVAAMACSLRSEPMVDLWGARDVVRAMQQFLSEGAWDDTAILHRLWQRLATDLGDADGVLILDGSEFSKQGQESVGAERQRCGEGGRTANCQAGVFLAYASQHGYALLDRRLYLPETWFTDAYADRRTTCGVPHDLTFMTRSQLGWAMIEAVVRTGTYPFAG